MQVPLPPWASGRLSWRLKHSFVQAFVRWDCTTPRTTPYKLKRETVVIFKGCSGLVRCTPHTTHGIPRTTPKQIIMISSVRAALDLLWAASGLLWLSSAPQPQPSSRRPAPINTIMSPLTPAHPSVQQRAKGGWSLPENHGYKPRTTQRTSKVPPHVQRSLANHTA